MGAVGEGGGDEGEEFVCGRVKKGKEGREGEVVIGNG